MSQLGNQILSDAAIVAADESIPWDRLDNRSFVITGATGLIGKNLVAALLARGTTNIILLVRNPEKARHLFGKRDRVSIIAWEALSSRLPDGLPEHVDYVIHCANMTNSSSFIEQPVETIESTLGGARSAILIARHFGARLCLLSTMETYGEYLGDEPLQENQGGFLDAMVVRNSYPEAKRLDEALCAAYASEYGLGAVVLRLSQTFGPGVARDDRRVFAEFARCALEGRDIVLLTDGQKRNAYLYTSDAVRAILFVAAHGQAGTAYNAANDATFCSIREMAEMVAGTLGGRKMTVRIEIDSNAAKRFRKGSTLRLDTKRLEMLGWKAHVNLPEMYDSMTKAWAEA